MATKIKNFEDYIILLQEDMWLNAGVGTGTIAKILKYIEAHDLKLVKLHSSEVYKTEELDIDFDGLALSRIVKEKSGFLMSHQISIWNKEFLIEQLKDNEHPWRNERRGSKRLLRKKEEIYHIDLFAENGKPPINSNVSCNARGEYHTISVNACIHKNARPFIEALNPSYPDYAAKLLFHLENEITHDGKQKPRKEDVFKKIKTKSDHSLVIFE